MISYETIWFSSEEVIENMNGKYPCAIMSDPRGKNIIKDGLIIIVPSFCVDKNGECIPLKKEFEKSPSVPVVPVLPSKEIIESFIMDYWEKEHGCKFCYVCRMPDKVHFGIVAHNNPLRKLTKIEICEIKKQLVYGD